MARLGCFPSLCPNLREDVWSIHPALPNRSAFLEPCCESALFQLLAPIDILREQRAIIAALEVHSEVRNDHVSNYEYFEGSLPEDQAAMLILLDTRIKDPMTQFLKSKQLHHM